jgi:hypothetical protein
VAPTNFDTLSKTPMPKWGPHGATLSDYFILMDVNMWDVLPVLDGMQEDTEKDKEAVSLKAATTKLKERLQWLNKVTAEASEELDKASPPPLKEPLENAVRVAKDAGAAVDVVKRAVDDLQEGFSGLMSAAKDFDAAAAAERIKALAPNSVGGEQSES